MDVKSAAIGAAGPLLLLLVKTAADQWSKRRDRELGIATLIGKLEAAVASVDSRFVRIEAALLNLSGKMDAQHEQLSDQGRKLDNHIEDEADKWALLVRENGATHAQ